MRMVVARECGCESGNRRKADRASACGGTSSCAYFFDRRNSGGSDQVITWSGRSYCQIDVAGAEFGLTTGALSLRRRSSGDPGHFARCLRQLARYDRGIEPMRRPVENGKAVELTQGRLQGAQPKRRGSGPVIGSVRGRPGAGARRSICMTT